MTDPVRYEKADVQEGAIVRAGIILAVVTLLSGVAVLVLFRAFLAREIGREPPPPPLAQAAGREAPEPRLQARPADDVIALRAEEREALTGYGWVDEQKGVVRIPVEEAMRILAERGLPLKAEPAVAASAPSPPPPAAHGEKKK